MTRCLSQFISASLGLLLVVSTLIISTPLNAKACPPSPETLFSLYMKSDMVILAEIKSETVVKITNENEDHDYVDVERNLDIIETFKGQKLREIQFTRSEYRAKPAADDVVSLQFFDYGGKTAYRIEVGSRYLFFIDKDPQTGKYDLSSYQGIRSIGDNTADVYKDRFAELTAILESKENQSANFAEWLVRLIEDPETLWDGAYVLSRSFYMLEYYAENPEDIEEGQSDDEYNFYSTRIAKSINGSQKERISTILYNSLTDAVSKDENADYNLINIVSNWDKPRLAMYSFSLLQNVDPGDTAGTIRFMKIVNNVVGDGELYELLDQYMNSVYHEDSEDTVYNEDPLEEEKAINSSDYLVEEKEVSEIEDAPTAEFQYEAADDVQEEAAPATQDLTPVQLRQKLLNDFAIRYQVLLAANFQLMPEDQ